MKDKCLAKQEARNDAEKREVGQRSEGRNVTEICDMQQERKKVRASGKMAAESKGGVSKLRRREAEGCEGGGGG